MRATLVSSVSRTLLNIKTYNAEPQSQTLKQYKGMRASAPVLIGPSEHHVQLLSEVVLDWVLVIASTDLMHIDYTLISFFFRQILGAQRGALISSSYHNLQSELS